MMHLRISWTIRQSNCSTDVLLDASPVICQSCGMPMGSEDVKGSEPDGSKSEEYCVYCYRDGAFARQMTLEEAINHNLEFLDDWNKDSGLNLTREEAREKLREFLPTLKRWKTH